MSLDPSAASNYLKQNIQSIKNVLEYSVDKAKFLIFCLSQKRQDVEKVAQEMAALGMRTVSLIQMQNGAWDILVDRDEVEKVTQIAKSEFKNSESRDSDLDWLKNKFMSGVNVTSFGTTKENNFNFVLYPFNTATKDRVVKEVVENMKRAGLTSAKFVPISEADHYYQIEVSSAEVKKVRR